MVPDTEKWGAFCPSLVPKHQVKHIISDRAAFSKLTFRSFKNNSAKKQGIYFSGVIREKNCGNHLWRWLSATVNRSHRTWLILCSHIFHILESGEEIWSLSAILPLQILRCTVGERHSSLWKNPPSQASPRCVRAQWRLERMALSTRKFQTIRIFLWAPKTREDTTLIQSLPKWFSCLHLCPLQSLSTEPIIFLKCLKILWWFSIALELKFKILIMVRKALVIWLHPPLFHSNYLPPSLHSSQMVFLTIFLTCEAHSHLRTSALALPFFLKCSFPGPRSSRGSFLHFNYQLEYLILRQVFPDHLIWKIFLYTLPPSLSTLSLL